MEIIAHRGYWRNKKECNSLEAMERAFAFGFGIETDIRDRQGKLVISHEMPNGTEPTLDELLDLYTRYDARTTLALNIKADGLADHLRKQLATYGVKNYFVFDMSIPDMRSYLRQGMKVYARCSEYEQSVVFADHVEGVWLDAFESDWFGLSDIIPFFKIGKKVCVVSSELHGRPHTAIWNRLRTQAECSILQLCTDFPEAAVEAFNVTY